MALSEKLRAKKPLAYLVVNHAASHGGLPCKDARQRKAMLAALKIIMEDD